MRMWCPSFAQVGLNARFEDHCETKGADCLRRAFSVNWRLFLRSNLPVAGTLPRI